MDYLSTKVDFFKDYQDEAEEAEAAVACIASNSSSSLSAEVARLRDSFSSTVSGLAWEDSVKTEFDNYVSQCTEAFNEVINSISAYFAPAEQAYQKMDTALKELKTANEAYQTAYGNGKPKSSDAKFNGVETTIENGVSKSTSVFYREKYEAAVEAWKTKVSEAAGKCIDLIVEIEDCKTQLLNTESNPLSMTASAVGAAVGQLLSFEIPEMAQVASAAVEAATALAGTFTPFKINLWGKDFGVLANITRSRTQDPDECLSYARAYAIAITEHNGYTIPLHDGKKNGCVYSSTDPNELYQILANEYKNGRSAVLEVNGSGNYRHFVALAGFADDTDFNNIKPEDILILDPTSTKTVGYKQLNTGNGGQKRYLKSARVMSSTNDFGTDYAIVVYSDIDYDTMYPNTKKAPNKKYGAYQSNKGDNSLKFAD